MKPDKIFELIEEDKKNKEFFSTGFKSIDDSLDGGFLKKEIIILGAFTGVGKSMLAGQMFFNIASIGFNSAYFSLEISKEMILSRLTGQIANIKPSRIMNGLLTIDEYDAKAQAKTDITMHNENINIYDDIYLLDDIEQAIRNNNYEFVVVDFIQNILLDNGMDEYARLSLIAVKLQKLAKETNSCILVLSQLSNRVGSNKSRLVEYKGSGAIAQVADLGFFMERDRPVLDINGRPIGDQKIGLSLRKNRRGVSGIVWGLSFSHPGGKIT